MSQSTRDRVEGKVHEAKGAVQEKLGGTVQRRIGEIETVFGQ
jgi:uncharacterized protein YjbJ (UPF0337 family)